MTPAAPHQVGKIYLLDGNRFLCLKVHPYPDHNGPNLYQSIDTDGKPITEKMNYGGVRPMLNLIFHQIPNMVEETNTPPSKHVHRYARPENEFDEVLALVPVNVTEQDFLAMAACNISWHPREASEKTPRTCEQVKEQLPDVEVVFNGKIYPAFVSGRRNDYAHVTTPDISFSAEYSWEAVTRCVNGGGPLHA